MLPLALACAEVPANNPYDPGAPVSVQARGELVGRVLARGQPAEGAQVALLDTAHTTVAGPDGAFTLTDIPAGAYTVVVEHPGFRRLTLPSVSVEQGETGEIGRLEMVVATGTITGQVALQGRLPPTAAQIMLGEDIRAPAHIREDGRFLLLDVPVGTRTVVARLPGFKPATSAAVNVQLDAETELEDPLVLERWTGALVGRVRLPVGDESAVEGIELRIGGSSARSETDAEGRFRLEGLMPGVHPLVVLLPGYRVHRQPVVVDVAYGRDSSTDVGEIVLQYAVGGVSGQITLADGATPSGIAIELGDGPTPVNGTTTEEGHFTFSGVRAGEYRVRASRFGYMPMEIRLTVHDGSAVDAGPPRPVELELPIQLAVVCGRMTFPDLEATEKPDEPDEMAEEVDEMAEEVDEVDEPPNDPVALASCPPVDERAQMLADATVVVVTAGGVPFGVLEDGYFRIEAQAGTHTLELQRAGFEPVTLHNVRFDPGDATSMGEIGLDYSRGGLLGQVRLASCAEADAQITIQVSGAESRLAMATVPGRDQETNANCEASGQFEIPGLRAGERYTITLAAPNHRTVEIPAEVDAHVNQWLPDVTLEINPGWISGTVQLEPDPAEPDASGAGTGVALLGIEIGGITDEEGRFLLADVPAGTYTVRITRPGSGYADLSVPMISVLPGQGTELSPFELSFARGDLRGTVVAEDGGAVINTVVTLNGPSPGVAVADEAGAYQLLNVRVGTYTVRAILDGYRSGSGFAEVASIAPTEVDPIVLRINPGQIVGRVAVPDGDPDGARIRIVGSDLEAVADAGSDDDPEDDNRPAGSFRIDAVRAGTYALVVEHGPRFRARSLPNVQVVAGATTDLGAVELALSTGSVGAEVALADAAELSPEARAAQIVTVSVSLTSVEGEGHYTTTPDPSGRVRFDGVHVGTYRLTARHPDYASVSVDAVEVPADAAEITLPDAIELPIRPGAIVGTARLEDRSLEPSLVAVSVDGTDLHALTGVDGGFSVDGLKAGIYSITLTKSGFQPRSVGGITVIAGGEANVGALELSFARSGLTGTARTADGADITGALVELDGPVRSFAWLDDSGMFEFPSVPVGEYVVRVALQAYVGAERAVTVEPDVTVAVDPVVLQIDPGRIAGQILTPEGSPAGARVAVLGTESEAVADAEGRFSVAALKQGTYAVEITHGDTFRGRTLSGITVVAGREIWLGEITLAYGTGSVRALVALADEAAPSDILVQLANADGESQSGLCNDDGVAMFTDVRVGSYVLRASKEGYATATFQPVDIGHDAEVFELADALVLPVAPGAIEGTVVLEAFDGARDGIRVQVVDSDETTVTDQAGAFAISLRAGTYGLTFSRDAGGFGAASLAAVTVRADETTYVGEIHMPYARGGLEGTVRLADETTPSGVVVTVHSDVDQVRTVTDASGGWQVEDLRVGPYVVDAEKPDFASESTNVTVLADEIVAVAPLVLEIDPGSLVGRIVLIDEDPDVDIEQAIVTIQQTGSVAAVTPEDGDDGEPVPWQGTFVVPELAPGAYTLTFLLDGYEIRELSGVVVEAGAVNQLDDVVLVDEKAPDAPVPRLMPAFVPLTGFPEEPAVLATDTVTLDLDLEASDPIASDSNFDPSLGLGHWELRASGANDWQPVHDAQPPYVFELSNLRPGLNVLEIRAVDASGNISTEGELIVMLDTDGAPNTPTMGEPVPGCIEDPEAAQARCVISGDAINLPIRRQSFDHTFGCYFLAEAPWPLPEAFDPTQLDYGLDNGECYPAGTQLITVFPQASATQLYCIRAYDQAGQASAPDCLLITEDSDAPGTPDLYPHDVEVRALQILLMTNDWPDRLDANFLGYEKRGAQPGARFVPTRETESFLFNLLPGETNTVAVRAVDRAGNYGEAVEIALHETTVEPIVEDLRAAAASPDLSGSMVVWAQPEGCDTTGITQLCRHSLRLLDRRLPVASPVWLTALSTCNHDCMFDGRTAHGGRAPIVRQSANGVLWADFAQGPAGDPERSGPELPDEHHLFYWSFGRDGLPMTGDDAEVVELSPDDATGAIVAAAVNDRLISYVRFIANEPPEDSEYRLYAHAVGFDEESGSATLVREVQPEGDGEILEATRAIGGNIPPRVLRIHHKTVLYAMPNGQLFLWTNPLHPLSQHAPLQIPALLQEVGGQSVQIKDAIGAGGTTLALVIHHADSGRESLHELKMDWDRTEAATPCACPDNAGCFAGYCADWQGEHAVLTCEHNDEAAYCGAVTALDNDGKFVAWTAEAYDQVDGNTIYKLVSTHLPGGGFDNVSPSLVVMRRQPLSEPTTHLDHIAYLDRSSGSPRLYLADPTQQIWLDIPHGPNEPKAFLRAGTEWLVYARFHPETDGPGFTPESGLYALPIDGTADALQLPASEGAQPGHMQAGWGVGMGYALERSVLVVAEREAEAAPEAPGEFTIRALDLTSTPWVELLRRTDVVAAGIKVTTDGRDRANIAYSGSTLDNDFGLRVIDIGRRDDPDDDVETRLGDHDCLAFDVDEARAVCLGSIDEGPDASRFIHLYWARDGVWTAEPIDLSVIARIGGGQPGEIVSGVWIDGQSVVFETTADDLNRLYRITAGDDGMWETDDDGFQPLYARTGENLGPAAVLDGQLVFADESLTQQPEILRIRLFDGRLDRLTIDDAGQRHPAISPRGIFFVDERYTTTAQGAYIFPPAITLRTRH